MKEVQQSTQENEASLHKLEQKQLDKHVFIAGLPVEPNEDEVLNSLAALYNISIESVDYKYSYKFRLKGPKASSTLSAPSQSKGKIIHQMVIVFKDQQMKTKFMQAKKENGPLLYEQITRTKLPTKEASAVIRCVNRLSKFNLKVRRELLTSKNEKRIFNFQLHNGTFRLKEVIGK